MSTILPQIEHANYYGLDTIVHVFYSRTTIMTDQKTNQPTICNQVRERLKDALAEKQGAMQKLNEIEQRIREIENSQ